MRTLRRSLSLLPMALFAMALPATGARAAGDTSALCTWESHEVADPGFGTAPVSHGVSVGNGVITCLGSIRGRELASEPGTIHYEYQMATASPARAFGGDTCQVWSGNAPFTMELPTADGGRVELQGVAEMAGSLVGYMHAEAEGVRAAFVLAFYPEPDHLDENCVTKPLRHFVARGPGALTGV